MEVGEARPVGRRPPRLQVLLQLGNACGGSRAQHAIDSGGGGTGRQSVHTSKNKQQQQQQQEAREEAPPCGSSRFSTGNLFSSGPSWSFTATGTWQGSRGAGAPGGGDGWCVYRGCCHGECMGWRGKRIDHQELIARARLAWADWAAGRAAEPRGVRRLPSTLCPAFEDKAAAAAAAAGAAAAAAAAGAAAAAAAASPPAPTRK